MILDSFRLHTFTLQVTYDDAFELWDRAGAVARALQSFWGDLKVQEGRPQEQTLQGPNAVVKTGFSTSLATLHRDRATPAIISDLMPRTFAVWRDVLDLAKVTRVSARSVYVREFKSIRDANSYLISLGLLQVPKSQVFNQEPDAELNTVDFGWRYQDASGFSVVRMKTEKTTFKAELDPEYVKDPIEAELSRVFIDFDRGTLGETDARKFRLDEWLKGYHHVLRRDLPKLLGDGK